MKSFLITLFITISVSVTFTACKKTNSDSDSAGQRTTVGGIVVSYPSKQPLAGIKVYLVLQLATLIQYDQSSHWSLFYLDTLKQAPKHRIDSTFTDLTGKYSFTYTPGNCPEPPCNGFYYPTILDPNYVTVLPIEHRNYDTIFIDQPSYFKVNLQKITPATVNDTLFEDRYFYNQQNLLFYRTAFRKAQVGQTNTTIIDTFSTNAYSKVVLEWRHYKNGLVRSSIDTISLIPNGTTVYNVSY